MWKAATSGHPALFLLAFVCTFETLSQEIHHYIYFNRDRDRIHDTLFLNTEKVQGAQLKYTWRELEPLKDRYDFGEVQSDLDFLKSRGKRLFIQLQDVSFDKTMVNIPPYLMNDPEYHGGADRQYNDFENEKDAVAEGWVARRWDSAVRKRFQKLLARLGKEFDGKIEGINLPETAVNFGESGKLFPKGFTFDKYQEGILENMKALKGAFPKSVTIQYGNFMPGEWLPWNDKSYLRSVYETAKNLHVGVGGPDLLPFKKGQMNHSYGFIRERKGIIPAGIAVQDGNYENVNPETQKQMTVEDICRFGSEYLGLDYIFWCTQEPYYSEQLIPFLRKSAAQK